MQWNDRIGRRLKLRDLHILLAVVQRGSMAKAASELAISQPAVSKAIADVEHTLGLRLLDRSRNGIEPTAYGRALVKRGVAIFDELKQGVRELEFLADPSAGEVRIGTTPPLAASFVSGVIDRLSRRYPRIVFDVATGTSETMQRDLIDRKVDLLIFRKLHFLANEELSFESLFESPYVVAADAKNPWARRRGIELAQLAGELWVLPRPNIAFGSSIGEAFRAIGLEFPSATVFADGHELRISLLRTGRYLTVLPEFLLHFAPQHPLIKVLPVELPISRGPIGIITPKNRTPNPVVQRFTECAREVAKSLGRRK
jgi:DNA-binding transcriptional LysR family regulator